MIVAIRTIKSTTNCVRFHDAYRVPWYALALAPFIAFGVHLLEVPGMSQAIRGVPAVRSHYR